MLDCLFEFSTSSSFAAQSKVLCCALWLVTIMHDVHLFHVSHYQGFASNTSSSPASSILHVLRAVAMRRHQGVQQQQDTRTALEWDSFR